jgi:hypothetical protein
VNVGCVPVDAILQQPDNDARQGEPRLLGVGNCLMMRVVPAGRERRCGCYEDALWKGI